MIWRLVVELIRALSLGTSLIMPGIAFESMAEPLRVAWASDFTKHGIGTDVPMVLRSDFRHPKIVTNIHMSVCHTERNFLLSAGRAWACCSLRGISILDLQQTFIRALKWGH